MILCAAIHHNDGKEYRHQPLNVTTGVVVCGWRHFNCFPILVAIVGPNRDQTLDTQGFIDSKGFFYNRKEAALIAFRNKQINEWYEGMRLHSEHLY